ncbi:hypothetical protein JQ625_18660 [Bradyrhizobium diazoefficiens]|nr:hypothetical protein [Bradyrhizobium diazoefficiens]MBR0776862.1 hypothetical protein [Bradyrhizobium diazoefficiens]
MSIKATPSIAAAARARIADRSAGYVFAEKNLSFVPAAKPPLKETPIRG